MQQGVPGPAKPWPRLGDEGDDGRAPPRRGSRGCSRQKPEDLRRPPYTAECGARLPADLQRRGVRANQRDTRADARRAMARCASDCRSAGPATPSGRSTSRYAARARRTTGQSAATRSGSSSHRRRIHAMRLADGCSVLPPMPHMVIAPWRRRPRVAGCAPAQAPQRRSASFGSKQHGAKVNSPTLSLRRKRYSQSGWSRP
jgi:hypothetical protein